MTNPFEKRATEYLVDDDAFLSMVSSEPLHTYLKKPAKEGRLHDRLVVIVGTPGSGKTTIARLCQFSTLQTLLRHQTTHKELVDALVECDAIREANPQFIGYRLPLESEYREIWELPYPDHVKFGLLTALLQARALLGWLRALKGEFKECEIEVIPNSQAEAAVAAIGGTKYPEVLRRAKVVEESIYSITAALVPPSEEDIPQEVKTPYRPFDVIQAFSIEGRNTFKPLVIFDDAHILHSVQLLMFRNWLAKREMKLARWMLMRYDALSSEDALECPEPADEAAIVDKSTINTARDITVVKFQRLQDRGLQKREFRKMATDMADKYLAQMNTFARRKLSSLKSLLDAAPPKLRQSDLRDLEALVDGVQRNRGVSIEQRLKIESEVDRYLGSSKASDSGEDVRLGVILILLHRPLGRSRQLGLFGDEESPEPVEAVNVNASLIDGSRIHLHHRYKRPYYFGIDCVSDASSDNAEQFLRLASALVTRLETQLIRRQRGEDVALNARVQDEILRQKAREIIDGWEFPQHFLVRRLVKIIGERCRRRTLEPNAPLNGGATGFGILMNEFNSLPTRFPSLARVLQFAVAYNVLTVQRDYGQGGTLWCLIELGGVLRMHYGLTFARGGFIESTVDELNRAISGTDKQ